MELFYYIAFCAIGAVIIVSLWTNKETREFERKRTEERPGGINEARNKEVKKLLDHGYTDIEIHFDDGNHYTKGVDKKHHPEDDNGIQGWNIFAKGKERDKSIHIFNKDDFPNRNTY